MKEGAIPAIYTYWDLNKPDPIKVFEIQALGILIADKLYTAAIGKNPAKQKGITCQITELPPI